MNESARELENWLKELPKNAHGQLTGWAQVKAEFLAEKSRANFRRLQAPPEETGNGLASIRVERGKGNGLNVEFTVVAGGKTTTKKGYDYMNAFEFGTVHQPARQFFYSVAQAEAAPIRNDFDNKMRQIIEGA